MYRVAVNRSFIAQHFLIGGDWGPENLVHSHPYRLEVELTGAILGPHNYLVDITAIESALDRLISQFQDKTLNELDSFRGENPSLEFFARLLCERLSAEIGNGQVDKLSVRLWENEAAWAGYEKEF